MMRALLSELRILVGRPHRGTRIVVDERGLCGKCSIDVGRNVRSADVVVMMQIKN